MNTLVLETTEQGDFAVDVYQKLSQNRILFISDVINDKLAAYISASLLLKNAESSKDKITIFLNSDGGDIRNALMIYDTMQLISAPIETVCIGSAMDEAALILLAGTKGMRFASKHSTIAVGQLVNNWISFSDLTDAKSNLDQAKDDNKRMMEIIAKTTGRNLKDTMDFYDRRVFFNAQQAVKQKLIDKVI